MKVIKSSLLALFSLLFVALSTTSVSALSSSRKKEYGYNGIFFYDPDWVAKFGSCDSIILTDLTGNSNAEKAWNFLLNAGISGVSDNPAAIAGIIGNLMAESNVNPFARNSSGCSGIYQACGGRNDALINELASHGISWGDESQSDAALQVELTYMINEPGEFSQYTNNLGRVSNPSPSSYAELFLVVYERAIYGEGSILDPGVATLANGNLYQNASGRRSFAESAYSSFSSLSPTDTETSSSPSSSASSSSSSSSASYCGTSTTGNSIADTAIDLAWEEDHITAAMEHTEAAFQAKPTYTAALESTGVGAFLGRGTPEGRGASCDVFVATVMHYSGLDTGFPETGPTVQESHMASSSSYRRITEAENGNYNALQPGDIIVNSSPQHIYIYVEINGQPKIAEAGYRRVTGEITYFYTYPGYHVYRYLGGA